MDRALGYLGLAARAGRLIVGAEDCARQPRRHGWLLVAAADAADNTLAQARALAREHGQALYITDYRKAELAKAVGRSSPVAVLMVCDEGLAATFMRAAGRDRGEQEERV